VDTSTVEYTSQSPSASSPAREAERRGAVRWALGYWEQFDWCVIPAHRCTLITRSCTCGDPVCDKAGKHPIGLWNARLPREELRARWGRPEQRGTHPCIATWQANLSLLTGARSCVVVADVDPRHDGQLETLWEMGWSQDTRIERTGGGGWHVYAACPAEGLRTRHDYAQGIEVLADGAQVIVAPSEHLSGNRYAWEPGHSPWEVRVAPLAERVRADLAAQRVEHLKDYAEVRPVTPGQYVYSREDTRRIADNMYHSFRRQALAHTIGRNIACFRLGAQLATLGFSDAEIAAWGAALAADLAGGAR